MSNHEGGPGCFVEILFYMFVVWVILQLEHLAKAIGIDLLSASDIWHQIISHLN